MTFIKVFFFFFWESILWTLLNSKKNYQISSNGVQWDIFYPHLKTSDMSCSRLWVTLFLSLWTCGNLIQWDKFAKHLTLWLNKLKDTKENELESPSRMATIKIRSITNYRALDVAKVSNSTTVKGKGMISTLCQALPWQSRIINPILALSSSWNNASM